MYELHTHNTAARATGSRPSETMAGLVTQRRLVWGGAEAPGVGVGKSISPRRLLTQLPAQLQRWGLVLLPILVVALENILSKLFGG